jgi:phenylpyruvate tautomerase PptA (4-oxalocrotonate tautomerase family)
MEGDSMSQVKIFGQRQVLQEKRMVLSDAIHASLVEAIGLPEGKRFQRFIGLEAADSIAPADRSEQYIIFEISMFEGRSDESKKHLIRTLFARLESACGILPQDVEITIFETPRQNWGIRGLPGDELGLPYKIDV